MAKKLYKVSQRRKFNGEVSYASVTYECDPSEIEAVIGKLAGVITVYEENTTLSSAEGATDVITGGLVIDQISMVHSEAKSKSFGAFNKPLVFDSAVSVMDLQAMFLLHKPFTGAYSEEKPDRVYPRIGNIASL